MSVMLRVDRVRDRPPYPEIARGSIALGDFGRAGFQRRRECQGFNAVLAAELTDFELPHTLFSSACRPEGRRYASRAARRHAELREASLFGLANFGGTWLQTPNR
ncbi:MAG: hypothetical protein ACRD4S_01245 [Candidatus Acidiferrales bacterium]